MPGLEFSVSKLKLTIGYSSLAERADEIQLPALRQNTEILIAVQGGQIDFLERDDVRIIYLDTLGAAKSRNEIIKQAKGEIVIFGDDDMRWKEEGITEILERFSQDSSLDLILSQSENEYGVLRKKYSKKQTSLSRFNSAKAATYEIAIRLSSFRDKNIFFHEDFGAGEKNYIGDEFIFISEACNADLNCQFIPITIAMHPSYSSGMKFGTLKDTQARACAIHQVFGKFSLFARLGFVLKNPLRFKSLLLTLRFIFLWFPETRDQGY